MLTGKPRSPEVRLNSWLHVPLHLAPKPCFATDQSLNIVHTHSVQVPLQLQVTGTGRTTMVDASPTMTAARLARVIEAQTGVPQGSFALYYGSRPMCGTLEESGVASGSTIELKFRGRGGGPEPQAANSLEVEIETNEVEIEINACQTDDDASPPTKPVGAEAKRIPYEHAMWILWGTMITLWIVDRFTTNLWPRQGFTVGRGTAGTDFSDGLKPGGWSVKFYDICARTSGRFATLALNLLYMTTSHSTFYRLKESPLVAKYIDMRDCIEANHRLHFYAGSLICVLTLVHVWSILVPTFEGYSVTVNPGAFEWPLSERTPKGFKDINPLTKLVPTHPKPTLNLP